MAAAVNYVAKLALNDKSAQRRRGPETSVAASKVKSSSRLRGPKGLPQRPHRRPHYQETALRLVLRALDAGQDYFCLSLPASAGEHALVADLVGELRSRGRVFVVVPDYEAGHRLVAALEARCRRRARAGRITVITGAEDDDVTAPILIGLIHAVRFEAELEMVHPRRSPEPIGAVIVCDCHDAIVSLCGPALLGLVGGNFPDSIAIGVTTTPYHAAGRLLGTIFPACIFECSIADMIGAGELVPLTWRPLSAPLNLGGLRIQRRAEGSDYALDQLVLEVRRPEVVGAIVAATRPQLGGRLTLAFAADPRHAQDLAAAYAAAGVPAAAVWGAMPDDERRRALAAWQAGELQLVVNYGAPAAGDFPPAIAAIVMACPTRSVAAYTKMIGPGGRRVARKADCLVFDVLPERSPDPKQILLPHIVPVPDPYVDGAKRPVLVLRDSHSQGRWHWQYHPELGGYTAAADAGATVWLMVDPAGSGLYRAGLFRHGWTVDRLLSSAVPLAEAMELAGDWLRGNANPRLGSRCPAWGRREITDRQWSFLERHAPAQLAELATAAEADAEIIRVTARWQAPMVRRALWGDALRELWLAAREDGGEIT
jgi:superfamily II DNA or RNA helicase